MEQRALKRLLLAAVVTGLAGAGTWLYIATDVTPSRRSAPPRVDRIVPEGTRIRVEVLNGTNVRGLARRASLYLRDLGFDVVRFDQDTTTVRDSTLIVDHTGHPEWARMVGDVLGPARLETEPDSSRYVDLTVRLGSRWRPPAKTLYP